MVANCTVPMFVRFLLEDFPLIEETMTTVKPVSAEPSIPEEIEKAAKVAKLVIHEVKELTENPQKALEEAKEVAEKIVKDIKERPEEILKKVKKLPF